MAVLHEHISFIFNIIFPSIITPQTNVYKGSVWPRNGTGEACVTKGGTESYMQSSGGKLEGRRPSGRSALRSDYSVAMSLKNKINRRRLD
jgi:hypothetical protein